MTRLLALSSLHGHHVADVCQLQPAMMVLRVPAHHRVQDHAIQLDPKFSLAYINRGVLHNEKRGYDRAIADYTRAIQPDPKLAVAYNNRGNAYSAKDDYSRAIADYTQAIELDTKAARSRGE